MSRFTYAGLYIDTETGGTDPQLHALTSICVGRFKLSKWHNPEMEVIYLPIRPAKSLVVSVEAAQVQGKSVAELYTTGEPEAQQLATLSEWLYHGGYLGLPIYAHNADFDRRFLAAACDRYFPDWGKVRPGDMASPTMAVCTLPGRDSRWSCTRYLAEYLVQKGKLGMPRKDDGTASVSLDPLMERLGILGRQEAGHDAEEDVRLGVAVLDALLRLDGWWE